MKSLIKIIVQDNISESDVDASSEGVVSEELPQESDICASSMITKNQSCEDLKGYSRQ